MQNRSPVVVQQSFDLPAHRVWRAITQYEEMIQWFFKEIPAFQAVEGFNTRFNVRTPNRDFLHIWTIKKVVPNQKIVYDWSYDGYSGASVVSFEIEPHKGGSILTVTHSNTEAYPQEVEEFTRESCLGGWNYFIGQRLTEYLGNAE